MKMLKFISFFSRFALSLNKTGCGSEVQIKKRVFRFALRSPCTIFV